MRSENAFKLPANAFQRSTRAHRTPSIERGITCGSSHQAVNVAMIKRFETNVPARLHKTSCSHDSQYARSKGNSGRAALQRRESH